MLFRLSVLHMCAAYVGRASEMVEALQIYSAGLSNCATVSLLGEKVRYGRNPVVISA